MKSDAKDELGAITKVSLVGVCSLAISSTGIIMRKAEHNDEIPFSPIAASFISEVMKMAVGILMCLRHPKKSLKEIRALTRHDLYHFLVPAFLYVLTNNVRYFIIRAVNPGVIGVLWNLKIVVVALLYQLPPFERRLSRRQWLGAALLVLGSLVAEYSQGSSTASDGGSNGGGAAGMLLVLAGLSLAASAGVSCEYAFKATSERVGFPVQCSLLYIAGAAMNLAVFVIAESGFWNTNGTTKGGRGGGGGGGADDTGNGAESRDPSGERQRAQSFELFRGFDAWAWAAVANISFVGLLISLIFKYIDTVAQVFSDVSAMFLTALLAWAFFDLDTNGLFLVALTICSFSIVVYYGVCERDSPAASDDRGNEDETDKETQMVPLLSNEDDRIEQNNDETKKGVKNSATVAAEFEGYESDEEDF